MNLWILLILLDGGHGRAVAIETIEFYSESSCSMARTQIAYMEKTNTPGSSMRTSSVCIRKGQKH